jgi:hypothetical protein
MNLSTFNSKIFQVRIIRSLIASFYFLSLYHVLIVTKIVKPSNGIQFWQNNVVRLQRYAYPDLSNLNIVVVGSSLTANLPIYDIGSSVINLGMSAGCAQTGIEAVERKSSKPALLLIEINETINRKVDEQLMSSMYNPFLYKLRLYIPMFREEYKPVSYISPRFFSVLNKIMNLGGLMNKPKEIKPVVNFDKSLTEPLINQAIEKYRKPLLESQKTVLRQEAESIKLKILKLRKDGVRVILFDIPREPRLQATVAEKQTKALLKEILPVKDFEWLPEPPPRDWKTLDGVHLVSSDAKDYVAFLKNQLLTKKLIMSKAASLSPTLNSH